MPMEIPCVAGNRHNGAYSWPVVSCQHPKAIAGVLI